MRQMTILCSIFMTLGWAVHVSATDLPTEWDWRSLGAVSSVKNQGPCGSCWAFASVAALESKIMIETGVELDLSEQILLNCTWGSCGGGTISGALNFIRDEGVVAESTMPYKAMVEPCPDDVDGTRYTIDSWSSVGDDELSVKEALVANGPLVTVYTAYDDFYSYKSGIYHHSTGGGGGARGMLLVGYSDSGRYWILKNSWSASWGEDGYVRIAYDDTATMMDLRHLWALEIESSIFVDGFESGSASNWSTSVGF
jgi:C1A family cysteine protease